MTARLATTWPALLAGLVVVYGVLVIGTALDTTARFGLLTLAAVLCATAVTERLQIRSDGAVIRERLGLGRPSLRCSRRRRRPSWSCRSTRWRRP